MYLFQPWYIYTAPHGKDFPVKNSKKIGCYGNTYHGYKAKIAVFTIFFIFRGI